MTMLCREDYLKHSAFVGVTEMIEVELTCSITDWQIKYNGEIKQ